MRMSLRWSWLVAPLLAGLAVSGCGGSVEGRAGPTGRFVVATTPVVADFATVLAGDDFTVHSILSANVDAHDYEPSPADLREIASADVVVRNGVGLEKWFEPTIKSARPRGELVDASAGVARRRDREGNEDPHIWHNPQNAKVMVGNLADAMVRASGARGDRIRARQARYQEDLDRLDAEIRTRIAGLTNKKVVTNHDAFGYYLERYGLEFVGAVIPSFDSQAELSARDIADIVARIKATGVRAIFAESSLPPKTAETIGREAGVAVVTGEDTLYADTLGPPESNASTYLAMMRHNTRVLVEHLG